MPYATQITRQLSWSDRLQIWIVLVSVVLTGVTLNKAFALDPPALRPHKDLSLHDRKLTARITAIPLRQVLDEVERLSGVQIRWTNAGGTESVSVEFAALPLADALERLLAGRNFIAFYRSDAGEERLTQIWISSRGTKGEDQSFPSPTETEPEGDSYDKDGPPVDLPPPLEDLLYTAMESGDPASLLDMVQSLGRYEDDPQAKILLSQLAQDSRNPQIQEAAAAALRNVE